jgi:hypothetical protein
VAEERNAGAESQGGQVIPARRFTVTEQVGPFAVSVGFKQDHLGNWTIPFEVFITARGKSGSELDGHLYEIGVRASKLMQGE